MSAPIPAPPDLSGATRLNDWGVIRATGADTLNFLHGQLTQDMQHLEVGRARLAGFCTAKGRLLATFVVWRRGADEALLACSADLLPTVLKRLSMFVMRAKCTLSDASAEFPLWGEAGGSAPAQAVWDCLTVDGSDVVRLPDGVWQGQALARRLWAGSAPSNSAALSPDIWGGLEASSGVARVMAATAEQFVPQMVNLELVGGVSFQKGCFPGQEIVARSQYRGTLKRRAQVVLCSEPLQPGQEIFSDTDPGQPAGMVVLAGRLPGLAPGHPTGHLPGHLPGLVPGLVPEAHHVALVEVKLAAWGLGKLHAGAADGPVLHGSTLPYLIPAEPA